MRVESFRKPIIVTRLPKKAPPSPAPARVGPIIAKPVAVALAAAAPAQSAPTPPSVETKPAAAPRRQIKPMLPEALQTAAGWPLVGHENQEHVPLRSGIIAGAQLYRCRCGLLLTEYDHDLWWVPVASSIERIETIERLGFILGRNCYQSRAHAEMLKAFTPEAEGG